jgi:thiamine biosynthesis protein ThiS
MHITVNFYGNLRKYLPQKKETVQMAVNAGATIRELLAHLGVADSEVWISAINDQVVAETTALCDGDVLEVFEPVGGGESQVSTQK